MRNTARVEKVEITMRLKEMEEREERWPSSRLM